MSHRVWVSQEPPGFDDYCSKMRGNSLVGGDAEPPVPPPRDGSLVLAFEVTGPRMRVRPISFQSSPVFRRTSSYCIIHIFDDTHTDIGRDARNAADPNPADDGTTICHGSTPSGVDAGCLKQLKHVLQRALHGAIIDADTTRRCVSSGPGFELHVWRGRGCLAPVHGTALASMSQLNALFTTSCDDQRRRMAAGDLELLRASHPMTTPANQPVVAAAKRARLLIAVEELGAAKRSVLLSSKNGETPLRLAGAHMTNGRGGGLSAGGAEANKVDGDGTPRQAGRRSLGKSDFVPTTIRRKSKQQPHAGELDDTGKNMPSWAASSRLTTGPGAATSDGSASKSDAAGAPSQARLSSTVRRRPVKVEANFKGSLVAIPADGGPRGSPSRASSSAPGAPTTAATTAASLLPTLPGSPPTVVDGSGSSVSASTTTHTPTLPRSPSKMFNMIRRTSSAAMDKLGLGSKGPMLPSGGGGSVDAQSQSITPSRSGLKGVGTTLTPTSGGGGGGGGRGRKSPFRRFMSPSSRRVTVDEVVGRGQLEIVQEDDEGNEVGFNGAATAVNGQKIDGFIAPSPPKKLSLPPRDTKGGASDDVGSSSSMGPKARDSPKRESRKAIVASSSPPPKVHNINIGLAQSSPTLKLSSVVGGTGTVPAGQNDAATNDDYVSEKDMRMKTKEALAAAFGRCDEIVEGVFIGGDGVARNKATLNTHGITHILNIGGVECENYFPDDYVYKRLVLQDKSRALIEPIFYEAIDFITSAVDGTTDSDDAEVNHPPNGNQDGARNKVLVHCYQGVSRSVTCVVVYLILTRGMSYDEALALVVGRRSVAKPNAGFMVQATLFMKRLRGDLPPPGRMYKIAPLSDDALAHRVAVPVAGTGVSKILQRALLQSDACFVIHVDGRPVHLWLGRDASETDAEVAARHGDRLLQHEGGTAVVTLRQGEEDDTFWDLFGDEMGEYCPDETATRSPLQQPPASGKGEDEAVEEGGGDSEQRPDDEVGDEGMGPDPKMFDLSSGEEYTIFDTDDLDEGGIFLLFDAAFAREEGRIYLWIGQDVDQDGAGGDGGDHDKTKDRALALLKEQSFVELANKGRDGITVVIDGDEDDAFWDLFS